VEGVGVGNIGGDDRNRLSVSVFVWSNRLSVFVVHLVSGLLGWESMRSGPK
jgi:hypothetical protein